MTSPPIRRGTARRLGLRRPISYVIYDEAFGFKPDAWQAHLLYKYSLAWRRSPTLGQMLTA